MRRLLRVLIVAALIIALLLGVATVAFGHPRPDAAPGPEGDAVAVRMTEALGQAAWDQTGAVSWTFASNSHLWDRTRHYSQVSWGETRVVVDLETQQGRAFHGDQEITDRRAVRLVKKAYAAWVNDSFWLCAPFKANDPGTNRAAVPVEGQDGVLVSYSSGGLTPGDAYLWLLGPDGVPTAWRMWVSVIPVGGVEASWEDWVTLPTGARLATTHRLGPATLRLGDVRGAATLAELAPGPDPFAPLAH